MKRLFAVLLALAMCLGMAACGTAPAKDQTGGSDTAADAADSAADSSTDTQNEITFVLDWTPNTNHTGLYVALEKGYFEEEGVKVTVVQPPEDGAETMVASGKAQFGISFQDSMLPAILGENALPITAVAAVLQHNSSGILSRAGEGMDTPKGLEGKKYATWDLPVEKAIIRHVMELDGGDFDKVELIPSTVTDEVSALRSSEIDAVWVYYGWAGINAEVQKLPTDYFAFADIAPELDYYTPVVIGNTDFLSAQPETARAFLKALARGYAYAIDNPRAAADTLLAAAPELNPDLVYASQEWMSGEYQSDASQWGYINPERWNAFYNWLNENNLASETVPEDFGFTNDYLPAAD